MKLYGSLTSPYVRKVRICLLEKALDCEFIVESPSDPDATVAKRNPLGKVPLLESDTGDVIFNSPMIVEYLDTLAGATLIPEAAERWRMQRWHALGDGIVDAVVARMLELRRPNERQEAMVIQRQETKVAAALDFADEYYRGDKYLEADQFSIADIAMAVALDYIDFRYPHDWRQTCPQLANWLQGINQRPSFTATAPPQA